MQRFLPTFNGAHSPLWLPYTQMQTTPDPIVARATQGCNIFLEDGRTLLDGTASWWTACHGYNHPHILQALQAQMEKMPHIMLGGIIHEQAWALTERLAALLPGDLNHTFLSDSGSVAIEVALKIARQYWVNLGSPEKSKILHFQHGYHGDTLGAMSVCSPAEGMHAVFNHIIPAQICSALPASASELVTLEQTLEQQNGNIAAMIVEPLVQGAGGMRFHSPETLQHLRRLCDDYEILLIADEIFTGFGRTGSLFACEQAAIVPDIMCLGKALSGGVLTLASTTVRTPVYEAFLSTDSLKALMHGPTYMGNPLACAAANASLDLFEQEPRLGQAHSISKQLSEELATIKSFNGILDVRVLGAIGVIEFHPNKMPNLTLLRQAFIEAGIWIRPFGHIVYLTPALTISASELSALTQTLVQVLSTF